MAGTTLPLDRAALSVALGRDNVVHLALTDPASAARVNLPLQRLLRFLGQGETNELDEGEGPAAAAGPSPATNEI